MQITENMTNFVKLKKRAHFNAGLPNGNLKIHMNIYNTIKYEVKPILKYCRFSMQITQDKPKYAPIKGERYLAINIGP